MQKVFRDWITKGKKTQEEVDAILAKITTGVKDICTDCDLIVEAALEVMDVKKQTFKELQDIVKKEDCIFATNTSSLAITEIGAWYFSSGYRNALLQPGSCYEAC